MPPMRTITPAKAVKTERTHEENQERAYIAASRRSDRSLEARVESARRASEIHKRRTGRSLRVTEQDVINEEMYEEEDDDLPLHYRRLTAHLQTSSVDFNRRLAAYLTNQVAMRSAMDQMISQSYAQQYPNAPQFAHNSGGNYPSPLTNPNAFGPPSNPHYRAAPYPSLHQANFRDMHARANSIATPTYHDSPQTPSSDARRMSMPVASTSSSAVSPVETSDTKPDVQQQQQSQHHAVSGSSFASMYPPLWQDHGLFTTSLPPESQQMLAPALDPNDPMTSTLMAGSEQFLSDPHYPWAHNHSEKGASPTSHPSFNSMSATLAPSALDGSDRSYTLTTGSAFDPTSVPTSGTGFNIGQDGVQTKVAPAADSQSMSRDASGFGPGSGRATPGEGFWDSFIQDGGWIQDTTSA